MGYGMKLLSVFLGILLLTSESASPVSASAHVPARTVHLIPPTSNTVIRVATVPHPGSATLSLGAMRFLRTRDIRYVIPRVLSGFPSVTAPHALRVAEARFAVGPYPRLREMTFIAIVGNAVPPLRDGMIVWAISFGVPKRDASSGYYIGFVHTNTPTPLGAVR